MKLKKKWKPKRQKEEWEDIEYWRENSRTIVFRDYLHKVMPSPDGDHFCLLMDEFAAMEPFVAAIVNIDVLPNQELGNRWAFYNAVHIRSIGVCNEFRGCGFFGTICKYLQNAADQANVFIYGCARPFQYDIPILPNGAELNKFLDTYEGLSTLKTDKKKKQESLELLERYIQNGFCRYNCSGAHFFDKFFKRNSFGYLGEGTDLEGVADYFNKHLSCN